MIDAGTIEEILKIYNKHDWTLRRVLLSDRLKGGLDEHADKLFGAVEVLNSDIDAAWFSRASGDDLETWEIRHLCETPFALLEMIDTSASESERNVILNDTESRLRTVTSARKSAL